MWCRFQQKNIRKRENIGLCNEQPCAIILLCQDIKLMDMGRFPSGQRGQTVNLLQIASVVRIHLCPLNAGVAELADAQDLKSCGGDIVPVRFRSPALSKGKETLKNQRFLIFFCPKS